MSEQHDNELIYPPKELVRIKKLRKWYVRHCKTLPNYWYTRVGVTKDNLRVSVAQPVIKGPSLEDYSILILAKDCSTEHWYAEVYVEKLLYTSPYQNCASAAFYTAIDWCNADIDTKNSRTDFMQTTG